MLRVRGDEVVQHIEGTIDSFGCVAEHVEPAMRQLQTADAEGDQRHFGTLRHQSGGAQQTGDSAADDHYVIHRTASVVSGSVVDCNDWAATPSGTGSRTTFGSGRCSTSSSPWKIHSSKAV